MEATVAYNGTFGKTTIGADVGYWEQHGNASSSFKSVRTGLSLGFGDVTIGMSYKDTQDLDGGSPGITTNGQESFEVGVSYAAGDMTVGTKYFNSKSPQTTAISGSDQVDKMSVGATYSLGAGVTLAGSIVHVEWDDETTADANNNAGWAAVGGLKIAF
jgi:predicted porin